MLQVCNVTCAVHDNDGSPIAGARITAQLSHYDIDSGYVVPDMERGVTGADGTCVLALWPNALGATASHYKVKIQAPNGKSQWLEVVVPDTPTANLHEIALLPPYPGKLDGQVAVEAAQAAAAEAGGYVAQIDTLVTIPLAQLATSLINTQTIVAEHHAFI